MDLEDEPDKGSGCRGSVREREARREDQGKGGIDEEGN